MSWLYSCIKANERLNIENPFSITNHSLKRKSELFNMYLDSGIIERLLYRNVKTADL